MKVRWIEIEGFRGISHIRLDLDAQLTVLVGENGAGKTSVLDALAILLDNYVARWLKGSAQSAERLKDTDIRRESRRTRLTISVVDQGGHEATWVLRKQERTEKILRPKGSDLDGLNAFVRRNVEARGDELTNQPLMIYYGQRRAVLDVPQRIRGSSKQGPEAAFSEALKLGDLNFREFVAWFRDRSLMEAQQWQSDQSHRDQQLEAVRQAMSRATGLERPYFRVGTPSGLCVRKNGVELRVDQLSSGERSFLSLAGDLGRRLAMLNPKLKNPLNGLGIILIDEVELHLHPLWQRKIIPWLLETFPNCQFVISTHSPQVLGRVHAQNIQALRVEGREVRLHGVSAAYGRDSNYILLSVLGGDERDESLKRELDKLESAISNEELDVASHLLHDLRSEIEGNPPELTLAQARLERRRGGRGTRKRAE